MLELDALPAKEGDAIWIRWGDSARPHQMLIDLGTERIGRQIRERLQSLPEDQRALDLVVVTHVDRDHIGGVLTCFAEADPVDGLAIDDIWFNGFDHLTGGSISVTANAQPAGAVQGERLTRWLRGQRWNRAFGGGPVQRLPGEPPQTTTLHDGLRLTILGPTPSRLQAFTDKWQEEVRAAIEGGSLAPEDLRPDSDLLGADTPPVLEQQSDLLDLANSHSGSDHSQANGSSIVLLLEYRDTRILLAGDAFADDLVDGINAVNGEAGAPLRLDLFKLPHHGSRNNIHRELVERVVSDRWLISTDGTRFRHPDAEAVARVIAFSDRGNNRDGPLLSFNVPSRFNGWWDNEEWRALFGYKVEYGDEESGLKLSY